MSDMAWFTLVSTVVAALAIALGVMLPAQAMGRAIVREPAGPEPGTMSNQF